jgi:hypothetical protein
VDGTEYGPYRDANTPQFSPDSQHVDYFAIRIGSERDFVVVDGKEEAEYAGIYTGMPLFSPDSRHYAYSTIIDDGKSVVVVDGKRHPHEYQFIESLHFSPDSRHVVYSGSGDCGTPVIDGQGRDWRGGLGRVVYSPDSSHLAFAAGLNVWNSKPGQAPDKHWWVVFDGQVGPSYDMILDPTVSTCVYNDTRPICIYDFIDQCFRYDDPVLYVDFGPTDMLEAQMGTPDYPGFFFDAPDHIHYLAIKEHGVYLVKQAI